MLPTKLWMDMTWRDFERADMAKAIAVLPVAAVEQHGPHLPVGADAFINEGHLARAITLTPPELDVLYLPVQWVGASGEHLAYPGTLTLSAETIIRAWTEIGDSVARTGCRKLIFANSHGGNSPFIDIVARELRIRRGMLAVNASWARFGSPDGLYSESERKYGIHGGDRETSLMLALRPETVKRSEAKDFASAASQIDGAFAHLSVTPPFGFGWMANDLNPEGAVGEAGRATPAKGEASLAFAADEFIKLLRDVAAFDVAQLGLGPLARDD
jgi:creatinine amidohydrolase